MNDLVCGLSFQPNPCVVLVGGIHGAGKSTLCRSLLQREDFVYLSPQEVEREHSLQGATRMTILKKVQSLVENCLATQSSFFFEHVMSGHYVDRLITRAKPAGFSIHLIYIVLANQQQAAVRVAERVAKKEGHDVEPDLMEQRLVESEANFWHDYRLRADRWLLLDNSGSTYTQVAGGTTDLTNIFDQSLFECFRERVQ